MAESVIEELEEKVRIRVEDNRIGIADEDIEKIWNCFYRGDKSRTESKGFGFSLFMVR